MSGDAAKKGPESISSIPQKEKILKKEEVKSREVDEATIGKEAYNEAIGMDESVEVTGKVSEVLTDAKEGDKGVAAGSQKSQAITPEQIRTNLLKNIPTENEMKKNIEKEIHREIKYLRKKAMKMLRNPSAVSYFEMNNLMKKIRELKGILSTLIKASIEALKTLWLRFVHGVL